mmetsp:Transcript_24121/g.29226  ORF Transcript_24121/g.29226 Transcript_24121/m.29226 type:complete len:420 (-) Transcript_24121:89-1348(-)|eukprot:CAMPEP_0197847728 /NCGR_PEP_ID=MMETSP1438-20131217/6920_1 /TAXON_ID=1461541 /ORGANISM="Pterosperma sp., Strain CCMP1384" /LENGTH=419 /DNA_ID=CAMNT_0043459735 /DNA_START=201 /DNA_END=1460 /DNA_ORIENTATION=-
MGKGSDGQTATTHCVGSASAHDSIFLVSTYTDKSVLAHTPKGEHGQGVYALRLDAQTGNLTKLSTTSLGPNVAFLVKHPTLEKLYATTECIHEDGEVLTLELDERAQLNVTGRQSAGGKSTCYINLQTSPNHMIAVNYWDAKVSVLPVDGQNGDVRQASDVLMQPGASYVAESNPSRDEHWQFRQRWPHSHCCVTEPYNGKYAYVTDLGQDKVFTYELDASAGKLVQKAEISLKAGRGPRHLIFHPEISCAYIVNELESSVSVFKYNHKDIPAEETVSDHEDDPESILTHVQTISTLPPDMQQSGFITKDGAWKAHSHCSEIRLHPTGKFLYVGNRGHDSLAVFAVDQQNGHLALVDLPSSGGKCPRNFNFDTTGRYMVVGNQDSNNMTVFEICMDRGCLKEISRCDLPSPNYVYAIPK